MLRRTLKGHSNRVRSMAFSPDGQTDTQTGKELQTLEGYPALVASIVGQIQTQSDPHISVANDWVAFRNQNLIWLPAEYRRFSCSAI
ncbi:hypothetical protein N7493_000572 [Penicillium malachiteum]|uniref:Uncharacterized protein n=1 Tax=Penicillium malachiteum TaxID=1324776 RepID=A0AAD6HWL5_9EURO|nr:hypothetical protein N7493_000572 [Penicillium malachiteum]